MHGDLTMDETFPDIIELEEICCTHNLAALEACEAGALKCPAGLNADTCPLLQNEEIEVVPHLAWGDWESS